MNYLKKLLGYIVTMAMVLTLTQVGIGAVHAEESYTLTLKNNGLTEHTFEIYQVFKGDLKDSTLSNIKWSDDITEDNKTKLGTASEIAKSLEGTGNDSADARAFAESVQQYLTAPVAEKTIAAGGTDSVTVNKAGYYLIKDKLIKDKLTNEGKSLQDGVVNGATTSYILKVVKNTTAETKLDIPTVTKKVKDKNDTEGTTSEWQDSADYDIGDLVPYQITGTMPANIDAYTSYKYVFTDTMSKGLTYKGLTDKEKNVTIKIDNTVVTSSFNEGTETKDDGSTVVTWTCDNLKGINNVTLDANTTVVVTYNAKLNENAVIGAAGNPNTVNLTYSNNPNNGGSGETGKTPNDKNIVFTYKAVVNKVDQDQKSLKGAGFTLQKKVNGAYTDVKSFTAGEATTFTFTGLDDGNYKLIELTTPAGYNTITPIEFTISATHNDNSDDPQLLTLSGDKTSGEATFTADIPNGSLTTNVVNKKGSVLPSTGGMGTTVLYVLGGVLVALAAAYVIYTKKHEKA